MNAWTSFIIHNQQGGIFEFELRKAYNNRITEEMAQIGQVAPMKLAFLLSRGCFKKD